MTQNETTANLYDYRTGDLIGPATAEQIAASTEAEARNQTGAILVDADGDVAEDGSWAAQQPGVRPCYTA